jgi:acetyl-CoA carboxylase carboxyl transferase subunit alpha
MIRLKVPIITVLEKASGGALGIGVGDKVYMMENTWYSVISPDHVLLFYGKAGNTKTSCRSFKIDIS